jgi:hypothetical protein
MVLEEVATFSHFSELLSVPHSTAESVLADCKRPPHAPVPEATVQVEGVFATVGVNAFKELDPEIIAAVAACQLRLYPAKASVITVQVVVPVICPRKFTVPKATGDVQLRLT